MSNERADEFLSWRGRLTAPDALPGQGLDDKELSWQRLAERLQRQPRRSVVWWIAAACLILVLFFPATHFLHPRPTRPPRLADRRAAADRRVAPNRRVAADRRATTNRPAASNPFTATIPVRTVPATRHPRSSHPFSPKPAPGPDSLLASTPPPAVSTATTTTNAITDPTTPMITAAATPAVIPPATPAATPAVPGRQLRVICYNEIGNPPLLRPRLASREPAGLRLTLGRLPDHGTGDPTLEENNNLTIKLISQSH